MLLFTFPQPLDAFRSKKQPRNLQVPLFEPSQVKDMHPTSPDEHIWFLEERESSADFFHGTDLKLMIQFNLGKLVLVFLSSFRGEKQSKEHVNETTF